MKLPEYDNRPGPGEPLYDDSTSDGEWDDIKFVVLGYTLPIGALIAFGSVVVLLLLAVINRT